MILGSVHVGDVVLADRKGRRFFALVTGKSQGALDVDPIDRRVTSHHVKAREVIEMWHKRRLRHGRPIEGAAP